MAGLKIDRSIRLAMLLKEEIAGIISREMKDPGLKMVTVTHVKLTKDLRDAEIFYSVLGNEEDVGKTERILDRASGFIRGELGRTLRIKRIPHLSFKYDDSFEKGIKIERLMREITGDE
ncbi:MAG: 30S ribosome-binding factor RbfA [Deltaproteobacteria bacterium]|nr:30S ribosome-binding factor RbfA [Deltaproteobacteria bacterium]